MIARITADGQLDWAKSYGGNKYERFLSVAVASDGGIVAAGDSWSTKGDFPSTKGSGSTLLTRLTPDGQVVWARTYGGESFYSVALMGDGSIVAAGDTTHEDADFPSVGGLDALVAHFKADGSLTWARVYGDTAGDSFYSVAVTGEGGILAAGYSTVIPPRPWGNQDAFVASLTPDGKEDWARTYGGSGGDIFESLALTADGHIVAAGGTTSEDGTQSAVIVRMMPDESVAVG